MEKLAVQIDVIFSIYCNWHNMT